ncbi:DUF177 domain-containing protein [bacterium]|nr:DUF177 domain-containing protein [bacterium]
MKLNVQALKEGIQSFEFEKAAGELNLDSKTFKTEITIKTDVEKRDKNLFVRTRVGTTIACICDLCLEEFSQKLHDEFRLLYASPEDYAVYRDDDEVRMLNPRTREIDLADGVRESLLLSVPLKSVCSDECKGLCPQCGANLNAESCHCSLARTDPRWDGLKKLIH